MKKEKILFTLFAILGFFMFCDAMLMLYYNETQVAMKDILFGIGVSSIGVVYLLSSKESK